MMVHSDFKCGNVEKAAKTLEGAAFHAWLTLGEWLNGALPKVQTRENMQMAYDGLGHALEEYKKVSK